jgi:RNA polymerase sigma factor (sigma-70 family)
MTSDLDLLGQYAHNGAQDAFTEIVRRHVDLVYSAALRQVRSPQLAEEVAQSVFTDLAHNAVPLCGMKPDTVLTAWLYQVTRRTAVDVVRKESRRQLREQIASEMNAMNATAPDWTHVEPFLDEAMHTLDDTDRAAVLLRYFENKSFREVGQTLGTSDDAAQKRVSRAVEHLREFLSKRGVTVGASGLTVVISANAVQAAPIGLTATISAAVLAGTAVSTSAVITATKAIAMTTLQKTLITAALAVFAGTGIYEARQAATLRSQVQTFQQQEWSLTGQIAQLQRERDDATNQLAALAEELVKTKSDNTELLKLRGEMARLHKEPSQGNDPFVQTALAWKAKEAKLRKLFEDKPDRRIPEMQLLTDRQWLDIARDSDLDSEDGIRSAMARVRTSAKMKSAPIIQDALKKFIEANNGNWPDVVTQLKPFFDQPIDDVTLQRYKILDQEQTQTGWLNGMVLIEKVAADKWVEPQFVIGPNRTGMGPTPDTVHVTFSQELVPVMQSYQSANNGQTPDDYSKLDPYVSTPEQKVALEKIIKEMKDAQSP